MIFIGYINRLIAIHIIICTLFIYIPISFAASGANVIVDCSITQGELFRFEKYNNLSGRITYSTTPGLDVEFMNNEGLHSKILRVWISEADYRLSDDTFRINLYDEYLTHASNLADSLLICIVGERFVPGNDMAANAKRIIKNIIKPLKQKYPKIEYVEALNEPDNFDSVFHPEQYYGIYKKFYEVINEVNAELAPEIPLKIGGNAIMSYEHTDKNWIKYFLDAYRDDPSPDKRLDFISYHTYTYRAETTELNPSKIAQIRPEIEEMLQERGISTDIPSFITEIGIFPGPLEAGDLKDDHLRQAAAMVSYYYWYALSDKNVPFNWVLRHASEGRKDQLVTRPTYHTNKFTPYGNAMKMMSMMKKTRIKAETDALSNGRGVYALAASDLTGISLIVWNYQYTRTTDYTTDIIINNLPDIFKDKDIRVKRYVINETHSNYHYDIDNSNLQMVEETIVPNNGSYNTNIFLSRNSLQMLVLEPINDEAEEIVLLDEDFENIDIPFMDGEGLCQPYSGEGDYWQTHQYYVGNLNYINVLALPEDGKRQYVRITSNDNNSPLIRHYFYDGSVLNILEPGDRIVVEARARAPGCGKPGAYAQLALVNAGINNTDNIIRLFRFDVSGDLLLVENGSGISKGEILDFKTDTKYSENGWFEFKFYLYPHPQETAKYSIDVYVGNKKIVDGLETVEHAPLITDEHISAVNGIKFQVSSGYIDEPTTMDIDYIKVYKPNNNIKMDIKFKGFFRKADHDGEEENITNKELTPGIITAKFHILNNKTEMKSITIIMALYSVDDRGKCLETLSSKKINIAPKMLEALKQSISINNDQKEYCIKVFVWNDINNMFPLSPMFIK